MKKKLTLFTVLLAMLAAPFCLPAQGCGQSIPVMFVTDWQQMDSTTIPCLQPFCIEDSSHSWVLPDSFPGAVFLYGQGIYRVTILDSCHLVVFDSCIDIGQLMPSGFQFHLNFPGSPVLVVSGKGNDSIGVDIKIDTTGLLNDFPEPFMDTDTLCSPTWLDRPRAIPQGRFWKFDGTNWFPVDALWPSGMYKTR